MLSQQKFDDHFYESYCNESNRFFTQKDELPMGMPLSGLFAEIYLSSYENKYLLSSCNTFYNRIMSYTSYVDNS